MFKQEYEKKNNTIKVTISIDRRRLAIEEKLVYMGDPKKNIPEEFRDKVVLKESPEKPISNIGTGEYLHIGVWVYQIKPQRRRTKTTTSNKESSQKTKTSTKSKASDIIKENN